MHTKLLKGLQSETEVRLVASLRDPRLNFPDKQDIRVFVPDIHLITKKRQKNYRVFTNQERLLVAVLRRLKQLRDEAAPQEKVNVCFLGDLLDLWREGPQTRASKATASRIRDDHEELMEAALDRGLGARFLLGNHDFDLRLWQTYDRWQCRYFLAGDKPTTLALHGDVFDWIESFPDRVQQVLVYLFAPNHTCEPEDLEKLKPLVRDSNKAIDRATFLQKERVFGVGDCFLMDGDAVPERFNVTANPSRDNRRGRYLGNAEEMARTAKAEHGFDLNTVVIGHTHFPRIVMREDGNQLFTLVDCGAWIDKSSWEEGGRVISPQENAHIGALSGNEVRIYQLGELTSRS